MNKKYQIIYADPPWSYQNGGVPQGGVNAQYQTMKLDDIKKLPVGELADEGCEHNFRYSHIEYPPMGTCTAIPPNKEVVICPKCGELRKTTLIS